jgi:hypothetical protein
MYDDKHRFHVLEAAENNAEPFAACCLGMILASRGNTAAW